MSARRWVPLAAIIVIHDRQIARHGGAPGLRDRVLLESGTARALNRDVHQPGVTHFQIAAAYAFGLAKAHAFVDGNKRTAFVTAAAYLRLNGFALRPDPVEGVRMMEGLASSAVSEQAFADWLEGLAQAL